MKYLNVKVRLIACFAVLCLFAAANTSVAQAQTPTSGAMLKIDGNVGATTVHLTIYDSQIHSGHVQTPPCDPNFPTDAYVLQGGSWTGCDPGDDYEVTDNNPLESPHQHPGIANLTGTGYSFHIETHYVCGGVCTDISSEGPYCNTSLTICANPDSGFLTVTNNFAAAFTGTITLQGNSPVAGNSWCPVNGFALDTWATGLAASGGAVRLGLGSQGSPAQADSSNCGGFNASQSIALTQGTTSKVKIGGDDFEITPTLGGTGDTLTILPIPVPAGPLTGSKFGSETVLFPALTGSRFSATNYPTQAIIPYADLSAVGNPVGLEFQIACSSNSEANDCTTFVYTVQTDFTIDSNSFPSGIGGAHFLGEHENLPSYNGSCPTSGFNVDIFLSYTGGLGDPPLLGSSDGWSCFAGTFDPTVAAVPAGTTVQEKTFVGFERPVSDKGLNEVEAGDVVPLIWDTLDSSGKPVKDLDLCKNFAGTGCTAPWVFIGTTPVDCKTGQTIGSTITPASSAYNLPILNFGNGDNLFFWKTAKGSTGCVTPVLKFSTGFVSINVADFKFERDDDH
jgi:hypothetical protein